MERSFAGRGPTLQQLLQATAAERARKATATAQVLGQTGSVAPTNTAAANAATKQVQPQQVQQQQIQQQLQQQAQLQKVQQQQTLQAQQQMQSSALQMNRFARRSVVDPNSKWAVHGKSIDEYNAEEAAAKVQAAASLANAAVNNSIVGGVTGNTTYYDVDASLADVYKQAVAAGVSVSKPTAYGKSITDAKKAQAVIDSYVAAANKAISAKNGSNAIKTTGSSTPYYDLDSSLNDIYKQASAAGVSIQKPTSYGKTITDAAKAQAIIDSYLATANKAITTKAQAAAEAATVYDVSSQYNDIFNQAKNYNVNVAKPTQTQFKTQAAAQAALDDYVSRVNKALENAPAPTYENVDPQKTSGYSYVYTMSHAQQNELIRENDYRRSRGLAEMSEYDFRKQEGVPVTTQQGGSYVKPKLNNKSYSSAASSNGTIKLAKDEGQTYKTIAPIGSGDIKLANMKAASTVDAKTNKPVVISAKQAAQVKAAAVQQKQQAAVVAADAATVAKQVAKDANAEAAAKSKQITVVKSQAKQTVNQKEKAALEKEVKVLEKEVAAAKETAKAADAHAKATQELATATKKAATVAKSTTPTAKQSTTASKAVEKAIAKVEKTSVVAQKAGVQDHTGQVLMKDGTWLTQIQQKGISGKGENNLKIYSATPEYQAQQALLYQQKKAGKTVENTLNPNYASALAAEKVAKQVAAETAKALLAAYKPVLGKDGKIIDAIQSKGKFGTGAEGLFVKNLDSEGNIIAASKTAGAYKKTLEVATKNAALPITPLTSAKDRKTILDSREYILQRTAGSQALQFSSDLKKLDRDETYKVLNSSGWGAPKEKSTFKTVDQLRQEKIIKNGGIGAALVSADIAFRNAFSYNNVTSKVNAQMTDLNEKGAKLLNLPTLEAIQATRDEFLSGVQVKVTQPNKPVRAYTLKNVQQKYSDKIYANEYGAAVENLVTDTYKDVRNRPVSAGLKVAELYAVGVAAGAVIGASSSLLAKGALKVASKSKGLAGKVAKITAEHAGGIVGTAGMIPVGAQAYSTYEQHDASKTVDFVASLAVGGLGFSRGLKLVKDPISIVPGVRTVKLQEISPGHDTKVKDIRAGETFSFAGKDIVSRTRAGKIVKGSTSVPAELTKGKIIQSFDKRNTEAYIKTLKEQVSAQDVEMFRTGKIVADTAYAQKNPLVNPSKFEILSAHIPEAAKPIVKKTIQEYGNILKRQSVLVYGSAPLKQMMSGYFSRQPQDLEIVVSNVPKFLELFTKNAKKAGLKENIDFQVHNAKTDAPKIQFKINEKWEKGVEVFANKSKESRKSVDQGYRPEDRIAFGYSKKSPMKVEKTKLMGMPEQAGRKFAGGHSLQSSEVIPVNPRRYKDVRDLIEIGVANEIVNKTAIADSILKYAKLSVEKSTEVLESPVAHYVYKRNRIPTNKGVKALASEKFEAKEKFLVAKRAEGDTSRVLRNSKMPQKYKGLAEKSNSRNTAAKALSLNEKLNSLERLQKLQNNVKSNKSVTPLGSKIQKGSKQKVANQRLKNLKNIGKDVTSPSRKTLKSSEIKTANMGSSNLKNTGELFSLDTINSKLKAAEKAAVKRNSTSSRKFRSSARKAVEADIEKELLFSSKNTSPMRAKLKTLEKTVSSKSVSKASTSPRSKAVIRNAVQNKNLNSSKNASKSQDLSKQTHFRSTSKQAAKPSKSPKTLSTSKGTSRQVNRTFKKGSVHAITLPFRPAFSSPVLNRRTPEKVISSKATIGKASPRYVPSKSISKDTPSRKTPSKKDTSVKQLPIAAKSKPVQKPRLNLSLNAPVPPSVKTATKKEVISNISDIVETIALIEKTNPVVKKKKQHKELDGNRKQAQVRLSRKIKNRLGNLESFFQ